MSICLVLVGKNLLIIWRVLPVTPPSCWFVYVVFEKPLWSKRSHISSLGIWHGKLLNCFVVIAWFVVHSSKGPAWLFRVLFSVCCDCVVEGFGICVGLGFFLLLWYWVLLTWTLSGIKICFSRFALSCWRKLESWAATAHPSISLSDAQGCKTDCVYLFTIHKERS